MSTTIRWGILGPGSIAHTFATGLQHLTDAKLVAVGSRDADKSAAFAAKFGAERAYGSYEELVRDGEVDIIYVATPHSYHKEHTLLCLEHGKAVLCEKPMAVNAGEVAAMVASACQRGLFLMEAMWTRHLPIMAKVRQWLAEKRIGEPRLVTADFGFRAPVKPEGRLFNPALAGGGLLDVGVYAIAFAQMIFGRPPARIQATAEMTETGVDAQTAMLLSYDRGEQALLSCAVRLATPQEARILGTEGSITIPAFWHATSAALQTYGQEPVLVQAEAGYHYEAREAGYCLRTGKQQSALMTWDDSLHLARTMDEVRRQIGLCYPMERPR